MTPPATRPLTERQRSVMERIDRRVPIKVIAQELGVSETRINQHIRALKDIFEADSLNGLVETYRAANPSQSSKPEDLSNSAYSKNQVPPAALFGQEGVRVDAGEIVINDVLPMEGRAPWELPGEPQIVPGVLDGENAVLIRFAVIIGIAFGILAAIVLMVTAALSLSEALDGKAAIPVEEPSSPV